MKSVKDGDDNQWKTVAFSFAAGAASMSLWMYTSDRRKRRRRRRNDQAEEEDQSTVGLPRSGLIHSSSFLDSVRQGVEDAVEDIKSRIGELPSTPRRHWPWETMHRNGRKKDKSETPEPDSTMKLTPEGSKSVRENPELCIGSIFGLDVGGTLAKLVYFEKRSDDDNMGLLNARERHYHQAASAQAVLKARRGSATREPSRHRTSFSSHDALRELTFSAGPLRKKLTTASSAALDKQAEEIKENESKTNNDEGTPLRRRHHTADHTSDSNEDLSTLYNMRQESVPDDLNAFATTVHYNEIHEDTKEQHDNPDHGSNAQSPPSNSAGMKKSRSMFDLSMSQKSRDHAEALDRFYHFARKLDSYREGVKDHKLSFYSRALEGEFHFIQFETRRMSNAMELIRANDLHLTIREMGATGGGAHKFAGDWDRLLGIQMKKQEELDSLVAGMQFVLSTVVGECYTFRPRKSNEDPESACKSAAPGGTNSKTSSASSTTPPLDFKTKASSCSVEEEKKSSGLSAFSSDESDSEDGDDIDCGGTDEWWWSRKVQRDAISYSSTYPYLLVTIGTGVSILRVDGPRKHERISGSTIGGGTYWGLIRLLTDLEDFEDVMRLAEHGDPSKVDMLVGDIYGNNKEALEKLGLPASLVASSFGKLVAREDPAEGLKQEDLARALLLMVTNNIGQVAYLNAQLHKTSRIYFVGNFLRGNKLSQRRLSFAINYWSKGEMEALFLEHEGYFGALGAFLLSQDISLDELDPPKRPSGFSHRDEGRRSHSFRKTRRRSQTLEEHEILF